MEKNYISEHIETCFYVNWINKTYGVYINIKDLEKSEEIKQYFKETERERIKALQQEWKEGVA